MTQVDFHFNVPNRLFYACQVAATVFRRGMTLAVWSADAARLQAFNAMLWEKTRSPLFRTYLLSTQGLMKRRYAFRRP